MPATHPERARRTRDHRNRVHHVVARVRIDIPRAVHRVRRVAGHGLHHSVGQLEEERASRNLVARVREHHHAEATIGQQHHARAVALHRAVVREHELVVVPAKRGPPHAVVGVATRVGHAREKHLVHGGGVEHPLGPVGSRHGTLCQVHLEVALEVAQARGHVTGGRRTPRVRALRVPEAVRREGAEPVTVPRHERLRDRRAV